jgi:PAS domain S-box-containing protein
MPENKKNADAVDTNVKMQSEEARKLSALIENVDVMLWSVREDENGEYYYEQVNNAFASVSGKTSKDYNGKPVRELGTEPEYKAICSALSLAKQKGVHTYQVILDEESGKRTILIRLIFVPAKNENYFIGYAVDTTLAKESDEKIFELEKKYFELNQYAPIGIARLNSKTRLFDFINNEFTRQSGYTLEELNSKSENQIDEFIHIDDRERVLSNVRKWVKSGCKGVVKDEYRAINKYNNELWLEAYLYGEFDADGKLKAVNAIYIDITERKNSEEKIHLLAHALESTSDMVTITDVDDNFIFVNKSFVDTYGYTLEDLKGKKPSILGSPKNPPDTYKIISGSTKEKSWKGELLNVSKEGREFPIQLTTSKILNEKGRIIGLVGVSRDISESRNAEEKLKQALSQKEILLKEVYHRVKNNLQVIYSLLHIQSINVKDPLSKQIFKETQNRIRLMSAIHEKLYKSKDVSQINFSEYLKTLGDQLEQAYPIKNGKIGLTIKSKDVFLGIDKAIPCGLMINELVSNAYKYAFEGKKTGKVIISLTQENNIYKLTVEDDGVGFPEDLDFKNTETLGMILLNTLTDQLGGKVELIKNNGTKFIITFE